VSAPTTSRSATCSAKYGEQARAVLEALLDKFADHGVQDIEDAKVLELPPFDQFGSKTQIRRGIFGSVDDTPRRCTIWKRRSTKMKRPENRHRRQTFVQFLDWSLTSVRSLVASPPRSAYGTTSTKTCAGTP
jgi:type I site-specific restriction endonuclease